MRVHPLEHALFALIFITVLVVATLSLFDASDGPQGGEVAACDRLAFGGRTFPTPDALGARYTVTFWEEEGEDAFAERLEIGPMLFSRLDMSARRRHLYAWMFRRGPQMSKCSWGQELLESMARGAFCAEGTLLAAHNVQMRPTRVVLERDPLDPLATSWRHEVTCP